MRLKTTQHPLEFILLVIVLCLTHGVQAQNNCDSALVLSMDTTGEFLTSSNEMWFRFQAQSSEAHIFLSSVQDSQIIIMPFIGLFAGGCDNIDTLHSGRELAFIHIHTENLIPDEYYFIKLSFSDSIAEVTITIVDQITVCFESENCIPECDNILFNGDFEQSHPLVLPNTIVNPPGAINMTGLTPFSQHPLYHYNALNSQYPDGWYTNLICHWKSTHEHSNIFHQYIPFARIEDQQSVSTTPGDYLPKIRCFDDQPNNKNIRIFNNVFLMAGVTYEISFSYKLSHNQNSEQLFFGFANIPNPIQSTTLTPIPGSFNSTSYVSTGTITYTPTVDHHSLVVYGYYSSPPTACFANFTVYIDDIKISPPKPLECPIISGPEVVCPGTTSITYTITNYDPVYVYRYSVNGSPFQIANGNTIQVDLATISGSEVLIEVKNWCECWGYLSTVISCDPTATADEVFLDGDIITQTHFSGDVVFICGDVFVGTNVTFDNNCEIIFAPKSSLKLLPGFTVTFDNSLLTDACLIQWKGVFANYDNTSIVVQNNCTIKHALNALVSSEGAGLDITNSLFHNNTTAVKIRQYDQYCDLFNPPPPLPPHPAYFAGNTFTRDISISFPGLLGPYTGIMVDTVYEVTVGDYTLMPAVGRNSFVNLDYGIKVSYSSVFVYNNLFDNIAKGTQMPFSNPQNNHPNEGAVYAWSVIPPSTSPNHPAPPSQLQTSCIANRITVGGQYQFQPNEFVDCNIGVYSDKFRINCDWNVFTSQRFNAVYSVDPGFESTVRNNQITQVPGLWATNPDNSPNSVFDAAIRLANTFQPGNGRSVGVNNNIIHHAKTGISLTNQTSAFTSASPHKAVANGNQIFFSNVDGSGKYWHGIRLEGCRGIQVGGNEVESSELGDAGESQEHVVGIYVSHTAYASIRDNSHLKNLFSGIFVVGNCLATQFYCNDFKGCKYGFYFKPYGNGAATIISDQYPSFGGNQTPSDNVWVNHIDNHERMWGDLNITGTGSVDWYHRHTNDASTIFGPNIQQGFNPQHPLLGKIIPVQTTGNSPCLAIPEPGYDDWEGTMRNARLGAVVREEIEYAEMIDEFEYFDQQYVYELLYSNPDIMYLGLYDDTAYINFYNYMTNSTIAEMTNINELIENGDINQALMENGVFVAGNLIENNQQVVNDIYLNSLAQHIPFDSVQREALLAIAMLTPYLGGKAVYSARVMLGIDPRDYNLYHRFAPDTDLTKQEAIKALHVYPNPARDNLTIEILEGFEEGLVYIELYSLIGNRVLTTAVEISSSKGDLNISGITSGIYLLRVSCEKGSHKSTKIMIH
jgi:hypothetical protein